MSLRAFSIILRIPSAQLVGMSVNFTLRNSIHHRDDEDLDGHFIAFVTGRESASRDRSFCSQFFMVEIFSVELLDSVNSCVITMC